jgi:hypothetical protein
LLPEGGQCVFPGNVLTMSGAAAEEIHSKLGEYPLILSLGSV